MTNEKMPHPVFLDIAIELTKINAEINKLQGAIAYHENDIDGENEIKKWMFESAGASAVEKIYSGIEKILTRIAVEIDGSKPSGDSSHSVLLNRMGAENPGIRPAVISSESLDILHELRRFRRRERNIYGYMINTEKLEENIQKAMTITPIIEGEIEDFKSRLVEYLSEHERD